MPSGFNELANGDIRPLSWGTLISFDKAYDDDITFFTLNQSVLNGTDLLGSDTDNPLQAWDKYEYVDYSERLISMAVNRELDFPYSTVSSIADFSLNNYDKYFTPNSASPIASYIIPKRPVRLLQGFLNTVLPQFVGLTQGSPEISEDDGTATFTAFDFLTQIYDMPIRETGSMQDVRTDEVLAEIFTQFGLLPGQYDLAQGRNLIKFVFFERGQVTAGDVIRPLMQAEGGLLWLSEEGIIKFRPRLEQPDDATYLFDADSIVSCDVTDDDQIINHVIITTDVREVQPFKIVYSKNTSDSTLNVVPANGTYVYKASLQDPLLDTVVQPTPGLNSSVSWYTASLPDDTPVTSGVTIISTELKTNTYEMTFQNTNNFSVNIDQLALWAQPAIRISVEPIIYENKDLDSIAKYEDRTLEINTNFIQDIDAARSLALTILDEYSEYADIIELSVKGNPAIQLADIVEVDYENYDGLYRIISISNSLSNSNFTQVIKCRRYRGVQWFTLNQSVLNGTDLLAP